MSRILIADDNKVATLSFSNFLAKEKNIEIIDIATNGIDAYNSYIENKPDILLLDLKMPGMTGIEIIDKLCIDAKEKKKNNIIVISGALSNMCPYNTSKIYRIMPKPIDYNELLKTICEIQNMLDYNYLNEKINSMFIDLKLENPTLKGTNYLKQAIIYCYNNEELLYNISLVYEMIAKDNFLKHIKAKNVLWSLESLIDAYEKSINTGFLASYFIYYNNNKNLTPKYLIELMVVKLWEITKEEK